MPKQPYTRVVEAPTHILMTDLEEAFSYGVELLAGVVTTRGRNGFQVAVGAYRGANIAIVLKPVGPSSTAIAIEELTRVGARVVIELSSAYALYPTLSIGDIIIASSAIKGDGVSKHYLPAEVPASADYALIEHILRTFNAYNIEAKVGIIWSTDVYYVNSEITDKMRVYHKIAQAMDLDTAALYTMSLLKKLTAASILVVEASQPKGIARGVLLESEETETKEKFMRSLELATKATIEALALHYEMVKTESRKPRG
ncbi:MAG: hypothetical protein ABWW69_01500 [Pyrodictiaceae archaeon]